MLYPCNPLLVSSDLIDTKIISGQPSSRHSRQPSVSMLSLVLAVLMTALVGCSDTPPAPAPAAAPSTTPTATPTTPSATQAPPVAQNATAGTNAELRSKATQALQAQRLHSPAGDNALEYYLALRDQATTPDFSVQSALAELLPYAMIAAEQAINQAKLNEAERLLQLVERTDPQLPGIQRLRLALEQSAKQQSEAEKQKELARVQQEQALAAAKQPPPSAPPATAAANVSTEQTEEAGPPARRPIAARQTPDQDDEDQQPATPIAATDVDDKPPARPAQAPAQPRPATTSGLRIIASKAPAYPRDALRSQQQGFVEVRYTVAADGSVSNIEILRSQPRGIFTRPVISALKTWKYEPPGQEVVLQRTFDFKP